MGIICTKNIYVGPGVACVKENWQQSFYNRYFGRSLRFFKKYFSQIKIVANFS